MLEHVDLNATIEKSVFNQRLPELQRRLYELEVELVTARIPVAIVFEGWAGTSKIGTIGALTRRLDPRSLRIHAITPPRSAEQDFPWLQRFWLRTPAYGEIAIFDRSWYREVLSERIGKRMSQDDYLKRSEQIVTFERQLAADGTVLLKFILHISKKEQQRRFDELLADRVTAIQVTDGDRWQHRHYNRVLRISDDLIARTNTAHAPWTVIPANDRMYAQLTVLEQVVARLEQCIGEQPPTVAFVPPTPPPANNGQPPTAPHVLRSLDLTKRMSEDEYDQKLAKLQAKLYLLGLEAYAQKRPAVLVFEGWDAAGKGGTIKRITELLDPRAYVVHSIAKPEGDDKQRHYLYRFWRRLPECGQIGIFDRSWYGRVLVERVEGFARQDEWQRAYGEINEFERQLTDFGTIVCKFWLHVSPEEQLRRFNERQQVEYKAWKLTDEDWRNRNKRPAYEAAVDDMVQYTSTPHAPWMVVASEDKRYARIQIIREVVRRMEDELGKVKL